MRAESGWLYSRASTPVGPLELHRSSLSRYLSHDEYTDPKPSELFMIRAGEMDGIIGDEDPTKRIAPVVDCQLLNGNMQVIRSTKHHRCVREAGGRCESGGHGVPCDSWPTATTA
ncbi:hypothetical protein PCANC_04480 [Puccinia coronata f. sp. avenae]|uniref:Uncharacterized protein n=1 Tax=Puccinia coronata f. sp. avenae TaxID=200324 RepID=A0A2N5UPH3_9BASI|nr:hypothetical protein PCASD_07679 [Puccinia coronata f. sp. avenae]PLW53711.1 hypothetical protein PCANC_04480 [Puccinia coronata f. sp. avenae]